MRWGSGQNGVVPAPCVSGASSHAVPASLVAQQQPRLELGVDHVRRQPLRHAQAHRQLAALLEITQEVVRGGFAVHHVRPGQPERVEPSQLLDVTLAQLRPAQPGRGAQHEVLRRGLAQFAGRDAVGAHDRRAVRERVRAGDVGELQRARRRQRRMQVREPHEGGRAPHRRADRRRRRRRVVVQAPGEQPAALRCRLRERRQHVLLRAQPAEIDPAGELGAPERVQVRVDQARDERVAARVQDRGARVAGLAHRGVVAGRDDRAVRHRDRRAERLRGVQRPDAGVDDRELSGHRSVSR